MTLLPTRSWAEPTSRKRTSGPSEPSLEDVGPLSRWGLMLGKINIVVLAGMGLGMFSLWAVQFKRKVG
jgi:hypothetical protein